MCIGEWGICACELRTLRAGVVSGRSSVPTRVLGTEVGSSLRAVYTLKH